MKKEKSYLIEKRKNMTILAIYHRVLLTTMNNYLCTEQYTYNL